MHSEHVGLTMIAFRLAHCIRWLTNIRNVLEAFKMIVIGRHILKRHMFFNYNLFLLKVPGFDARYD